MDVTRVSMAPVSAESSFFQQFDDTLGFGVMVLARFPVFFRDANHQGVSTQENMAMLGIQGRPIRFVQIPFLDQVLNVPFSSLGIEVPGAEGKVSVIRKAIGQRLVQFQKGQVLSVSNATGGDDFPLVVLVKELLHHRVVGSFPGARGKEHNGILGLDPVQVVGAGDLFPHEQAIPFPQHEKSGGQRGWFSGCGFPNQNDVKLEPLPGAGWVNSTRFVHDGTADGVGPPGQFRQFLLRQVLILGPGHSGLPVPQTQKGVLPWFVRLQGIVRFDANDHQVRVDFSKVNNRCVVPLRFQLGNLFRCDRHFLAPDAGSFVGETRDNPEFQIKRLV